MTNNSIATPGVASEYGWKRRPQSVGVSILLIVFLYAMGFGRNNLPPILAAAAMVAFRKPVERFRDAAILLLAAIGGFLVGWFVHTQFLT